MRSAANRSSSSRLTRPGFLVAIDFYINESTRHAHLILPTPSPAEQSNYEVGLYTLSVRNVAKWSWPAVPAGSDQAETWQVLSNIGARLMGMGGMPPQMIDDFILRRFARVGRRRCTWDGPDAAR